MTSQVLALAISDDQLIHWAYGAVAGLLALLIAIIGFFVRMVHGQVQRHEERHGEHDVSIARLQESHGAQVKALEGLTKWMESIDKKLDELRVAK